jgi:hypothetical protein
MISCLPNVIIHNSKSCSPRLMQSVLVSSTTNQKIATRAEIFSEGAVLDPRRLSCHSSIIFLRFAFFNADRRWSNRCPSSAPTTSFASLSATSVPGIPAMVRYPLETDMNLNLFQFLGEIEDAVNDIAPVCWTGSLLPVVLTYCR